MEQTLDSDVKPRKKWPWHLKLLAFFRIYWKSVMIVLIPLALSPLLFVNGQNRDKCGFMILVMAAFWILELLPLAATAVMPVVLCPLLGILSTNQVSMMYMKGSIMLFVGGKQLI